MASTQIQSTSANETFNVYSRYNDYPNAFPGDQADDPVPPEVTQVLVFNRGFGSDTIETNVPIRRAPGNTTLVKSQPYVIQLGDGITLADVELVWISPKLRDPNRNNFRDDRGYNLTWSLSIKGTTDVITVRDFLPLSSPWPTTPRGLVGIEFADGSRWTPDQVQLQLMGEVSGASTEDADSIVGSLGNDVIKGLAGDDTLLGNYGDDTLQGGAGNDSLNGAYGFDTYVFNRGDGHDTIALDLQFPTYWDYLDNEYRDNGDVLRLGAGIGFEDFVLSALDNQTGYRLDFTSGGQPTGDSVDLLVRPNGGGSEHVIRFADGNTLWTSSLESILNGGVQPIGFVRGTSGDDTLQAFRSGTSIDAGEGNDRIISGAGDDTVRGGAGADVLVFGAGSGADQYISDQSDQQDVIELTGSLGLNDFVVYNDAFATGANLSLVLKDGSAALLLTDLANNMTDPLLSISDLPSVKLGDGTVLSAADLYARRQQSSDGADTLYATPFQDMSGGKGDDLLIAGALGGRLGGRDGNDTLVAGTGSAILYGGEGADTYVLGPLSTTRAIRQTIIDADDADTIEFAAGIQRSDVLGSYAITYNEPALKIQIAGNARSSVEVLNMRQATGLRLKFADGSIGKAVDLLPVQGLRLIGSNFDDTLKGFLGNDTLEGGGGNDLLEGDAGADTYRWSFSQGDDTIVADNDDTIEFTYPDVVGLTIGKLGATTPNAVVLRMRPFESSGSITLTNAGQWAGLRVKLPDGSVITGEQIMAEATKPDDLTLQGTVNADTLQGGAGNDTLNGLAGNDVLDGGAGADTYQFSVGDGSDTIYADGLDTITLGAGLTKADVQIGKLGAKAANAVVLGMGSNAADTITLDNAGSMAGLQLKFSDGSTWNGADILLAASKPDNLTLTGTTKANGLTGKDGNDTLSGLAGNDTLAGGKGNDVLIGGKGSDTYLFNRGDGQDRITENDTTWFVNDLLKVGGATSKQLWFTKNGNSLDISVIGTQDKVTIEGWFLGSANKVEKITAGDGKSLSAAKVQTLVNAMASFTPPADGVTTLPTSTPTSVTKVIASSWA